MASRSLSDLHPVVHRMANQFINDCHAEGIDVLIYCTLRTGAEQDLEFAKGRSNMKGKWIITAPRKVVTYARGGQSFHQYGCALDFVPLRNGQCVWNAKTREDQVLWIRCVELAEKNGFTAGFRWAGAKQDGPHIQWSGGLSIEQLIAGNRPPNQ